MEGYKEKRKMKVGILKKTWERCKSFGNIKTSSSSAGELLALPCSMDLDLSGQGQGEGPMMKKSKSWSSSFALCTPLSPRTEKLGRSVSKKKPRLDSGCFSVYVGPDKQRFVMKVGWTSHPLFRVLLEEAESEYGFNSEGPLVLPCHVDVFVKVLLEMDPDHDQIRPYGYGHGPGSGCGFSISNTLSYQHLPN